MNPAEPTQVPDREPVRGSRRGPGARLMVLYGAIVLSLLTVFGLTKPRGLLEETLQDLREIFFFGFAALIILEMTALIGRRWIRKRSLYYAVAVVAVAGLLAGYQLILGGDPESTVTPLQTFVGAFGFLALSAALDRGLKREHAWLRGWPRRSIGILGALLVAAVLSPLGPVLASYAGRAGAFPEVVDLAAIWQEPFVELHDAELFVGKGPEKWPLRTGKRVALLLLDGAPGAGVMVQEPFKDWTGFDVLKLNLFSTAAEPITVNLRLEDSSRILPPEERITYPLRVMPGANDFFVPLEAFRTAPSGREIDLSTVRRMGLFLAEPSEPLRLYVHRIRLAER
ncbi:hypothetical protein [Thioalkalivibrio sp. XN8]|uniref:hypothetical protein n=1 Tax=Thioalkalivibrio sp. XN8 TaxID=2712863 RepID=UPI0013EC696F|nr:hypothetical protein [Thioalkalivibrio sp. XN8]NGP52979.1 hypothetical protein [Thioalkalivibrio sp. XN8]